ncbi:unnamed protein product, partial [Symbiodinium natans]
MPALQRLPERGPRSQPRPVAEDCRSCGASYLDEAAFRSHSGLHRPTPSPPDAPPQTRLWTPGVSNPRKGPSAAPAAHDPLTPSSWRFDTSQTEGISLGEIVGHGGTWPIGVAKGRTQPRSIP